MRTCVLKTRYHCPLGTKNTIFSQALSRNLAKQLIVEEELKRAGVQIEYALAEYPDTPEGRLNKHIRATIAEYEREKIVERNVRGRRNMVRAGRIMLHGNRPPYGYRVSEDGENLTIHEPEARIVRLIYQWYVDGDETGQRLGMASIARRLSEMQVPTWADVHRPAQKWNGYGKWSHQTAGKILKSETYCGHWYYGRRSDSRGTPNPREYWLQLEVPAIVSVAVWKRAQQQRERNRIEAKRNVKAQYLMRHRLQCQCGRSVCATSVTVQSGTYAYYYCGGVRWISEHVCDLPYFRVDQVDAAVWRWVKSFLSSPGTLIDGLNEYQAVRDEENTPIRERVKVVDDLISGNQQQLARLLDLYLRGDFSKDVLTDRKSRLEQTISALEKERIGLAAHLEAQALSSEQIQDLHDFAKNVSKGLEAAEQDFETRRRIIETLDVQAALAVEDTEKVSYVRCALEPDEQPLSIADPSSKS